MNGLFPGSIDLDARGAGAVRRSLLFNFHSSFTNLFFSHSPIPFMVYIVFFSSFCIVCLIFFPFLISFTSFFFPFGSCYPLPLSYVTFFSSFFTYSITGREGKETRKRKKKKIER